MLEFVRPSFRYDAVSIVCTPTHHTLCICSQLSLCRPYMVHGCSAKLGTVQCENEDGATLEPLFLVEGQFFVETGSKLGTDTELALELLQWKRGNVVLTLQSLPLAKRMGLNWVNWVPNLL